VNPRLMQQHIIQTTGKVVTTKDIHNLHAAVTGKHNDVSEVLNQFAASNPGDDVHLLVDSDKTVRQILIQTAAMQKTFAKFPEVLLLGQNSHHPYTSYTQCVPYTQCMQSTIVACLCMLSLLKMVMVKANLLVCFCWQGRVMLK